MVSLIITLLQWEFVVTTMVFFSVYVEKKLKIVRVTARSIRAEMPIRFIHLQLIGPNYIDIKNKNVIKWTIKNWTINIQLLSTSLYILTKNFQ